MLYCVKHSSAYNTGVSVFLPLPFAARGSDVRLAGPAHGTRLKCCVASGYISGERLSLFFERLAQ